VTEVILLYVQIVLEMCRHITVIDIWVFHCGEDSYRPYTARYYHNPEGLDLTVILLYQVTLTTEIIYASM